MMQCSESLPNPNIEKNLNSRSNHLPDARQVPLNMAAITRQSAGIPSFCISRTRETSFPFIERRGE